MGIGYPTEERLDRVRRTYDLTTPADPEMLPPTRIPGGWPKSGGADAFLKFLVEQLRPRIEKEVSINRQRQTLIGHSFGGLFVMHTLFTRPDAFQNYVAISPSVWWNDYALGAQEQPFSAKLDRLTSPVHLTIAVGELELSGDVGPAAALKPTEASKAFGSTRDFAQRMQQRKSDQFTFTYHEFADKHHGSVVPIGISTALTEILGESRVD